MASLRVSGLLAPVVALNGWTFAVEVWMYATRLPAMSKNKVNMDPRVVKEQMAAKIPPEVQWKADNYNHLFEQPTQFYAVAIAMAVAHGATGDDSLDVKLAWTYVGLRVLHSLIQCTSNKVPIRFMVFGLSSAVLAGLTARAALLVF